MLKIAQVLKSNGTDGGLLLSFLNVSPEEIDLEEPVFISFDGLPVPFYFESFTRRGTARAVVTLTGVHSLKDAEELVGLPVYADYFEEEEDDDLTGWTVFDANGAEVGTVSGYEDIPGNLCIYVKTPGGEEVLLPLNQELVVSMDAGKRILTLEIPEGLL